MTWAEILSNCEENVNISQVFDKLQMIIRGQEPKNISYLLMS